VVNGLKIKTAARGAHSGVESAAATVSRLLHFRVAPSSVSASAVDAMLKEAKYSAGSLYSRIEAAEQAALLTKHMADWAHDIRLDANDERHADENAPAATVDDATKFLEFAEALAELLFVLPARVKRGRKTPSPAVWAKA
jgi:hypothetical protein